MSRTAWPKVPTAFVQRNLAGHKLLGLALGALLYLVCLSGTATVFFVELAQWETARSPVVETVTAQAIAVALADARAAAPGAKALAITPPTPDEPRLTLDVDETDRAYDADGRYAGEARHPLTDGLTALHYELSLPSVVGVPIVGLAGVGLTALILGGLLAHPRIFRDAFLWRRKAGARLGQTDLHNRLGAWGAPFHLTIALTGAAIGLVSLVLLVFANGDGAKANAVLTGPPPTSTPLGHVGGPALQRALDSLGLARPTYIVINNFGSNRESLTITVDVPGRLAYGETYEFDGLGRMASHQGLTDGAAGKQIYASVYKLHFGSYGGVALKLAYTALGAGLCLICASGMDLWLIKSAAAGKPRARLRRLWSGFVWMSAAGMALAALATLTLQAPFAPVFWSLLAAGSLGALAVPDPRSIGGWLTGGALLGLAAAHLAMFGVAALRSPALAIDLSLALAGAVLWVAAARAASGPHEAAVDGDQGAGHVP